MKTAALCVALALAAAASATGTSVRSCGSLSVGPTAIRTSATGGGAPCLLAAFKACAPATYRLSSFGVDTIGTTTFTVTGRPSACNVAVAVSFEVVPQKPRETGGGTCAAVGRSGSNIVATGCHGSGLTATISLSGKR